MRNRATLHDVAVIGGKYHDVLAVLVMFKNLLRFSLIWDIVI